MVREKPNKLKRFAWEVELGIEGEATKVKDIKFSHEELPFYLWDGTRNDSAST